MKVNKKGYLIFESKVAKIKEIFGQLENIFSIDEYKKRLLEITNFIEKLDNGKIEQKLSNRKLKELINKLDSIIRDINNEYSLAYKAYLLTNELNNVVDTMNEYNYQEILAKSKGLLDLLWRITYGGNSTIKEVVNNAFHTIYQIVLQESVLEKSDMYSYILNSDDTFMDMLITLTEEKLNSFPREELNKLELNSYRKMLSNYVLDSSMIKKIAMLSLSDKNIEYLNRKNNATMELLYKRDEVLSEKKELDEKVEINNREVKNLKVVISNARKKIAAYVLVPIMATFGIIYSVTNTCFRAHKVTTRTYNYETNETIGEEESTYEIYAPFHRKGVVKYCNPWHENPMGKGYVREVCEINVTLDDYEKDIYKTALESFRNLNLSFEFSEELTGDINTTKPEWIITETIKDMNDSYPTTYGFGLSLALYGIALTMYTILGKYNDYDYFPDQIKNNYNLIKEAKKELNKYLKVKVIKESYANIGEKIVELKEEYDDCKIKYDCLDIDLSDDIIKEAKKYLRK